MIAAAIVLRKTRVWTPPLLSALLLLSVLGVELPGCRVPRAAAAALYNGGCPPPALGRTPAVFPPPAPPAGAPPQPTGSAPPPAVPLHPPGPSLLRAAARAPPA